MTIDQMQEVLRFSFLLHGMVIALYISRRRPSWSKITYVSIAFAAFLAVLLMPPYSYTYPYPAHGGAVGRTIAAVTAPLILIGCYSIGAVIPNKLFRLRKGRIEMVG